MYKKGENQTSFQTPKCLVCYCNCQKGANMSVCVCIPGDKSSSQATARSTGYMGQCVDKRNQLYRPVEKMHYGIAIFIHCFNYVNTLLIQDLQVIDISSNLPHLNNYSLKITVKLIIHNTITVTELVNWYQSHVN